MKKKKIFFFIMKNELNNYFSFYFLKFIDFEKFIKENYLFKKDFKTMQIKYYRKKIKLIIIYFNSIIFLFKKKIKFFPHLTLFFLIIFIPYFYSLIKVTLKIILGSYFLFIGKKNI
jgi:hypothetical protein